MDFPFNIFRRNIPDPGSLLVNAEVFDKCDDWQLADREHMIHIFREYSKAYALDVMFSVTLFCFIGMLLGWVLSLILGIEGDFEGAMFDIVLVLLLSYCLTIMGMRHIIGKYEEAMEESMDDY